jgi:hypothetical protein
MEKKDKAKKTRIRKLTKVELENVVGSNAPIDAVTYSRFAGNSGRWGDTC